jgi:AraC-like DNA-binding protein
MTVLERVRWLRISQARRLLAERNATVKSVARRLGFSSPFYFSRVFREVTGITPIDYLRQQQKYGR